jgi:hypothetical protein
LDTQDEIGRFAGLNVIFSEYPAARKDIQYAFKPAAASACETDVKTGNVIWLDRHMIVLAPCVNLLLNPSEQFAYLPPHYKLLGMSADEPINKLWETLYRIAEIDESMLFPMYTMVDNKKILPYFKGDHFSFRADTCIMQKWDELFYRLAEHQDMKQFLDEGVRTYLHQIALTLTVLKNINKNALKQLPKFYGYPTGSHKEIDVCNQASQMEQLHTAYYNCNDSIKPKMPVSKQLTAWLKDKVNQYESKSL